LADANGLQSDASLVAGSSLTVPEVKTSSNDASTFKPYDPSEITGPTAPSLPYIAPPNAGCNVLSVFIMAVVAAVVMTYAPILAEQLPAFGAAIGGTGTFGGLTLGAAATASAIVGAGASAVGNGIVSLLGEGSFSWRQVASDGLAAGLAAGLSQVLAGLGRGAGTGATYQTAASGTRELTTLGRTLQGVGNYAGGVVANAAVGRDTDFRWSAVAASALGAYASAKLGGRLPAIEGGTRADINLMTDWRQGFINSASNATAKRLMGGGTQHWGEILADSFGNALGNAVGGNLQRNAALRAASRPESQGAQTFGLGPDAERSPVWALDGGSSPALSAAQSDLDPRLAADVALLMELNRDQPLLAANFEQQDTDSSLAWFREQLRAMDPFASTDQSPPETVGEMSARRIRGLFKDNEDYGLNSDPGYAAKVAALNTKLSQDLVGDLLANPETADVGRALWNAAALSVVVEANPGLLGLSAEFGEYYRAFQHDLMSSASYQDLESQNQIAAHWKSALSHVGIEYVSRATASAQFKVSAGDFVVDASGYHASLFRMTGSNNYVLANRGTEINSLQDLATDVYGGMGYVTRQFEQAVDLAVQLQDAIVRDGGAIGFTGHSLGGGLASAQAMKTRGVAYTFNAMGLHPRVERELGLDSGATSRIAAYHLSSDQLSLGQDDWRIKAGLVTADMATGLKSKLFMAGGYNGLLFDVVSRADSARLLVDIGSRGAFGGAPVIYPAVGRRVEIRAPGGHGNMHVLDALYGRAMNSFSKYQWSR
jgi:hypothetical protein